MSDEKLISLLQGELPAQEEGLKFMFRDERLERTVLHKIKGLGGSLHDAQDAYQEGFRIFYRHVLRRTFRGESSPSTYFISICINVWKDSRRGAYQKRISHVDDAVKMDRLHHETPEAKLEQDDRKKLVRQLLALVSDRCREILWLRALSYSMEEIAEKTGLSSPRMAINEAFRCSERLRKAAGDNPDLQSLF